MSEDRDAVISINLHTEVKVVSDHNWEAKILKPLIKAGRRTVATIELTQRKSSLIGSIETMRKFISGYRRSTM